jgi:hypothetical protein
MSAVVTLVRGTKPPVMVKGGCRGTGTCWQKPFRRIALTHREKLGICSQAVILQRQQLPDATATPTKTGEDAKTVPLTVSAKTQQQLQLHCM